ncbi:MAG: folate family ECF transporter S component [Ruminococcus sp.]|nr:folate family ECF transporter S component [Ruminococcus sp.]
MKSFLSLFTDSAKSLKELRTLTTTGMLLALAIAIRSLAIQITLDLRIVFTFLPLCVIAMLYGPVVSGLSTFGLDIIGFIIDNKSARGYSIQLALVELLVGVLYGIFLYKKDISKVNFKNVLSIVFARGSVVLFCNILLNSYLLYTLYINKDFSVISFAENSDLRSAFMVWWAPRITKNLIQFPIDVVLLCVVLPAANAAYKSVVKHSFKRSRAN